MIKSKKTKIIVVILLILVLSYIGYELYINSYNTGNNINNIKSSQIISTLDVSGFKAELEAGDKILIDIRTKEELDTVGLIKNDVMHLDIYENNFSNKLDNLDKTKKYLIYCAHGNRSKAALDIMKNKGFKYIKDLAGGISAWINSGEEVFK